MSVDSLKASGSYYSACKMMRSHKYWHPLLFVQPQLIMLFCSNYVLLQAHWILYYGHLKAACFTKMRLILIQTYLVVSYEMHTVSWDF